MVTVDGFRKGLKKIIRIRIRIRVVLHSTSNWLLAVTRVEVLCCKLE
jgi:hypothetical protein